MNAVQRWLDFEAVFPSDAEFVAEIIRLANEWADAHGDGMDTTASVALEQLAELADAMKALC